MIEFYYIQEWLFFNKDNFFKFIPLLMIFEMPILILVVIGVLKWKFSKSNDNDIFCPPVSIIITCYNEEHGLIKTIRTLKEQIYSGSIEILLIVDDAYKNNKTYNLCLNMQKQYSTNLRKIIVIPKWKRGGLVSSANAGLTEAKNEIVFRVDGDCSFDNDMVFEMVKVLSDENVIASSGTLRVQNQNQNLLTILQSLEYIISIQQGKTGMSNLGFINNISGAFGVFKKSKLKKIGGWNSGTAEDLDLTIRLKQYFKRNPNYKIKFQPTSINHTEVPSNIKDFILQRIRWDGDLTFQILKNHKKTFTPFYLGWKNFIFSFLYDVIQIVIIPLLVILYSIYILLFYGLQIFIVISFILYLFYLIISFFQFLIHLLLITERFKQDFKLIIFLPIYPIYLISCKYISIFALLNQTIRNAHHESNMAPWWVLKRRGD